MIWAQVLIVAWLLTVIGLRSRIIAAFVALLVLVPLHEGVSLAMALRGLWGDPSITMLQLLALAFAGRSPAALRYGWRFPAAIVFLCLALYASELGPWNLDLYRLGYQPDLVIAVFCVLALSAWWRGHPLYLWLLTIDLLAWRSGLLESRNLWDTLLDPLLMLIMLALALRNGYRAIKIERTSQPIMSDHYTCDVAIDIPIHNRIFSAMFPWLDIPIARKTIEKHY